MPRRMQRRMQRRPTKFVFAILVNILTGIPFAVAGGETATADGCLTEPKGDTPPGGHWYYRIDHVNKRNCWYLRHEGGGLSQVGPRNSLSPKPPAVDARAELPARSNHEDGPAVSAPANVPAPTAWPAEALAQTTTPIVAARWPPPTMTNPAPEPGADNSRLADNRSQAVVDLPSAVPPSASFANSLAEFRPSTIPALVAATIGALTFAGTALLISRGDRTRRLRRRTMPHAREPVWETTDDDRIVLSDHPLSDPPRAGNDEYRPRFARDVKSATASDDRPTTFTPRKPRRASM